ncbi:myoblast determination protein 1 homolog 2 [Strongylocentrotus purpuratus]|uniref:BHLH domain-containing protein n=1 Tax=Strongylocentrotus purpuratus TaxID=7668 RepID=A0A7M7GG75_STRPU|nr:myoblast determination protein 1 homolog 2 [Strongylocentrotus purpuratus]|eukprot:XP_003726943.2 PREDICTED: myoblast determination protein 1 homolog 2-like [Strongylocentrotus purpuratus]
MSTFQLRQRRVRQNATARERRRLAEVNRAYSNLSNHVPQHLLGNATKLEVLRGAACYIELLTILLSADDNQLYRDHFDINDDRTSTSLNSLDQWDRNIFFNRSTFSHFLETFRNCSMRYEDNQSTEAQPSLIQLDSIASLQPGLLSMDDPPPKANISWR